MEIKYGKQIISTEIKDKNIDLFLCAENHEKRSFTLFDKINSSNKITKTIAFCYKSAVSENLKESVNKVVINDYTEIYSILNNEFNSLEKDEVTIVVDYSCMTKPWYYSIILYLKNKDIKCNRIIVYFSYTPSVYVEPKNPKPNKNIGPLPGKYVVPTDKPKALIVCLGYEQNKAEGIIEHLDPKISYLFYTKPAAEKNFVTTLEINNKNILQERCDHVITYPYNDLLYLEKKLTSLYYQLKDEYSIIIAPLGPKPFTFISIMMSVKYNDIDIWRVGSGYDINEYDNEPLKKESFIICEVLFESE